MNGFPIRPRATEGDTVKVAGCFGVVVTRLVRPPTATVDTEPRCTGTGCGSVLEYTYKGWTCERCNSVASLESLREYCRNHEAWRLAYGQRPSIDPGEFDGHLPPGTDLMGAAATLRLAALPTRVVHLPRQSRPGTVILGVQGGPAISSIKYGLVVVLDWPAEINATAPSCDQCRYPLLYDEMNSVWTCRDHGTLPSRPVGIERYFRPFDWRFAARVTPKPFCRACAQPFKSLNCGQSDWRCGCNFVCDSNELGQLACTDRLSSSAGLRWCAASEQGRVTQECEQPCTPSDHMGSARFRRHTYVSAVPRFC